MNKIKFTPMTENNSGALSLPATMTIGNAIEFKTALLNALDQVGEVRIQGAPETTGDLTVLQVLCAGNLNASRSGKKILLDSKKLPGLMNLARKAGFLQHQSCKPGCVRICLWEEKE